MTRSDLGREQAFRALVKRGFERVASLAEGSPSHSHIFARQHPTLGTKGEEGAGISAEQAYTHFRNHLLEASFRYFVLPPGDPPPFALGYGYTANNRREFEFLREALRRIGADDDLVNFCDLPTTRVENLQPWVVRGALQAAEEFLAERPEISEPMMNHMLTFVRSAQAALYSLKNQSCRLFVVANDHSPTPVAYALVAERLGMKTVYVQHAEVSRIFPPLQFDLSILRNQRSREIYSRIGDEKGLTIVMPRGDDPPFSLSSFNAAQDRLRKAKSVKVVVYPSAVFEEAHLFALVSALERNSWVSDVSVKLHPNFRGDITQGDTVPVSITKEIPDGAHVAVTGSSSIATELLSKGNIVFQDPLLDQLLSDPYGFKGLGLVSELAPGMSERPFWRNTSPLGTASFQALCRYSPTLLDRDNVVDAIWANYGFTDFMSGVAGHKNLKGPTLEASRFYLGFVEQDSTRKQSARISNGAPLDDEETLRWLLSAPIEFKLFFGSNAHRGPPPVASVFDAWVLSERLLSNPRPPTRRELVALRGFTASHVTTPPVNAWLKALERELSHRRRFFWRARSAGARLGQDGPAC